MNRKSAIVAFTAIAILAVLWMAYFNRGDATPENPLALTIGPRTRVPVPEFVKTKVTPEEFQSVLDSIVRHEDWFGSLQQATIRYAIDRTNYPPQIRQMRDDLKRDLPELEVTEEQFPYLKRKEASEHWIAFDKTRFAFSRQSTVPDYCQSIVWDGKVATGIAGPAKAPTNYFLLGSRIECAQRAFMSFPIIGHAGSRHFEDMFDTIMDERPEISVSTRFNDRECLVVQTWNDSWIVDRDDHRVHARIGFRDAHLFSEHREVAEDVFWPMALTYRRYTDESELSLEVLTRVEEFETELPPDDGFFEQKLVTGIKIHDLRHAIPVSYPHDPNRSEEEWKAIEDKIAENRRRERDRQKRRRSIIGNEAPRLGSGRWLNSDPISIEEIRERGAEIGFVGVSCGPCDNILPGFAADTAGVGPLKILVFNHRDNDDRILAKLSPYGVQCPVFVPDSGDRHNWGDVYAAYKVDGMPTLVTVEPGGLVGAHSLGMFAED